MEPSLGELCIDIPPSECGRFGLATILLNNDGPVAGQRVRVGREHWCHTPPCAECTFEVVRSEKRKGDFFLSLRDVATGAIHRTLHRWDEVEPAPNTQEDHTMQNTKTTEKAAQFALRVSQKFALVRDWAKAFTLAQDEDEPGAAAYRAVGVGADTSDAEDGTSALSLSVRPNESFDQLAQRYATEHGVSLRQAVHEVARSRPDMAAGRD